jgi:hypothetical protein
MVLCPNLIQGKNLAFISCILGQMHPADLSLNSIEIMAAPGGTAASQALNPGDGPVIWILFKKAAQRPSTNQPLTQSTQSTQSTQ